MERCYEIAHSFRFYLLVLTLILWSIGAFAFWPPDLIPHPPVLPEEPNGPRPAQTECR